eukprot:COSAG02_NODE_6456_length_3560_cov_41.391794_2_plen_89_part_00
MQAGPCAGAKKRNLAQSGLKMGGAPLVGRGPPPEHPSFGNTLVSGTRVSRGRAAALPRAPALGCFGKAGSGVLWCWHWAFRSWHWGFL